MSKQKSPYRTPEEALELYEYICRRLKDFEEWKPGDNLKEDNMAMSRDIKKGSGAKGGVITPVPDYNKQGSGNTAGKNKPVEYRKLNANSTTIANKD